MADPFLTLAWLVLAHLAADFVFQTSDMATGKAAGGTRALGALVRHALVVGGLLLPLPILFGAPGAAALAIIALSHALIDRLKVATTRRAERLTVSEGGAAGAIDPRWSPTPAALFLLDQAAHILVLVVTWSALLRGRSAGGPLADAIATSLVGLDSAAVQDVTLSLVVFVSLVIVNVRAGSLFVTTLVRPPRADPALRAAGRGRLPAVPSPPEAQPLTPGSAGFRLRLGWLDGRIEPLPSPPTAGPGAPDSAADPPLGPPARVGETIGILERLIIVAFVLSRAEAAIGLVLAAKTIARYKQLDDREFAEYYLLGTLASVAVAVLSGLAASAILA